MNSDITEDGSIMPTTRIPRQGFRVDDLLRPAPVESTVHYIPLFSFWSGFQSFTASSSGTGEVATAQGMLSKAHNSNKTSPVKKYKCDVCARAFSRSNTLLTHKRIHSGEKPFTCEICGRSFRQPGNLTRHRLTHTTLKPYECATCKRAFNRASNLHTHLRTHGVQRTKHLLQFCSFPQLEKPEIIEEKRN